MHSHLAFGIDDGARNVEESIALVEGLTNLGYQGFITTPHIMADHYKNTPETISDSVNKVNKTLNALGNKQQLRFAAEYYYDSNFIKLIQEDKILSFGNKYVLFELSYLNEPMEIKTAIFELKIRGYKPILAHPERYPYFYQSFRKYEELSDFEVLMQVNLASLFGAYSPMSKKIAEKLIDMNLISFVGTDCHNLGHLRALPKALESKHLAKLIDSGRLLNPSLSPTT